MPREEDPRAWVGRLARYRGASSRRALIELAITAVPFLGLWLAMWLSLAVGYWLTLLLALPAAGFLVRLFVIQHDCGHGSFFLQRRANDWLGRVIGVLTLTPYGPWRHQHALHHGTSGNLDRRGEGDVDTLTVREYRTLPAWRRSLTGPRETLWPCSASGLCSSSCCSTVCREHPLHAGGGLARRDGVQPRHRRGCRRHGGAHGPRPILLVQLPIIWLASADGSVAVLRAAPVRADLLGPRTRLDAAPWRPASAARILTCRGCCAGSPRIGMHHVHHLSSQHPELPAGRGAARPPRVALGEPLHFAAKFQVFSSGALGRRRRAAGQLPPGASHRTHGQRACRRRRCA